MHPTAMLFQGTTVMDEVGKDSHKLPPIMQEDLFKLSTLRIMYVASASYISQII